MVLGSPPLRQDFTKVFGMGRAEFYALPKWRQQKLKKDAGLF